MINISGNSEHLNCFPKSLWQHGKPDLNSQAAKIAIFMLQDPDSDNQIQVQKRHIKCLIKFRVESSIISIDSNITDNINRKVNTV